MKNNHILRLSHFYPYEHDKNGLEKFLVRHYASKELVQLCKDLRNEHFISTMRYEERQEKTKGLAKLWTQEIFPQTQQYKEGQIIYPLEVKGVGRKYEPLETVVMESPLQAMYSKFLDPDDLPHHTIIGKLINVNVLMRGAGVQITEEISVTHVFKPEYEHGLIVEDVHLTKIKAKSRL